MTSAWAPTEQPVLTIAIWPDDRASGLRALRAGLAGPPSEAARLPASASGFAGLDLMLGEPAVVYGAGDPGCGLVALLAAELAVQAVALRGGGGAYAPRLRAPGGPGNTAYLDGAEAARALMTQALAAVERTATLRLARPLGEPARPRPARAEAWRTVRSLPDALASLRGAVALARALADGPLHRTEAALGAVEGAAAVIADPGFQDIADPAARLRLEALHQRVGDLHAAMRADLGAVPGIAPGFNALDGD